MKVSPLPDSDCWSGHAAGLVSGLAAAPSMLFNSLAFLVFFPLVTAGYFLLPHRVRWCWLLGASAWFYMQFVPVYILILGFTIVVDYLAALWIEGATGPRRRLLLGLSLVANIGVLAVFKYYNFLNENLRSLAGLAGWNYTVPDLTILLPIGLSFHTFQAMSYTIEVYRGAQKAERHFGIYSLYVMFFPQLVAGPIERPQNLIHQFHEEHHFDYARVVSGLRRMAFGLFKKVVVADRLALVTDRVFDNPAGFEGPHLLISAVFFGFQIYCDFSGYSDMAVGAARVLGFNLMENFDRPYASRSVGEFWRRWHISLSTWFKDYLYVPLGGSRVGRLRWAGNVSLVFLVSGLWHGANWTYVAWGALHGAYIVVAALTSSVRSRMVSITRLDAFPVLLSCLQVLVTFVLVNLGWILFRARSLGEAWLVVSRLGRGWAAGLDPAGLPGTLGVSAAGLVLSIAGIAAVEAIPWARSRWPSRADASQWPWWLRWGAYYAGVAVVFFGYVESTGQFIYFQF